MGSSLSPMLINQLRANKKFYMVGKIVPKQGTGELFEEGFDYLRYDILTLTEDCKSTRKLNKTFLDMFSDRYLGFDTRIDLSDFPADRLGRMEYIEKNLVGKLILFRPKLNIKKDFKDYKVFKNIEDMIVVDSPYNDDTGFERIPILDMDLSVLKTKLQKKEIFRFPEYSTDLTAIKHIMCGDYLLKFNPKDWSSQTIRDDQWRFIGELEEVQCIRLNDADLSLRTDNTLFLPQTTIDILEFSSGVKNLEEILNQVDGDIANTASDPADNPEQLLYFAQTLSDKESEFILHLQQRCKEKHLSYTLEDLINFHVSVKTGYITIVEGPTGVGKSALAQTYAEMLSNEKSSNILFLPINPNYLEPRDVFGWFDPKTKVYNEAGTGLVKFLYEASIYTDNMYFVILDEMNLSQVEYWFAPILAISERAAEERYLSLYPESETGASSTLPRKIKIADNVRFIGTVNQDETTKSLSDRLLDRSNLVSLSRVSFASLKSLSTEASLFEEEEHYNAKLYNSWVTKANIATTFKDEELVFFDSLQEELAKISDCKCISFRSLKAIATYIENIPKGMSICLDRAAAIDIQFKQRVLSKLKGAELLPDNSALDVTEALESNSLLHFLSSEEAAQFSSFDTSRSYLEKQIREVFMYGFNY